MKSVQIVNGGPAFPTTFRNEGDLNVFAPDGAVVPPDGEHQLLGMSLRDYFAAQALIGFFAQYPREQGIPINDAKGLAVSCYAMADALLAEREK